MTGSTTRMQDATIRMIGYPLGKVIAALERGDTATDSAHNVRLAEDHAQAAYFVSQELDKIVINWHGTQTDLDFVRGFVKAFPDLYEQLPPAPPFTRAMDLQGAGEEG